MPIDRDLHIDVPLSNLAIKAFQGSADYVGSMLFPQVPVGKQSDKYYTISKNQWLRVPTTLRAKKTAARRIEFDVSSDSYYAYNYACAGENALEDLANADNALMLRENTTANVTEGLLRDMEVRIANLVTSISNVGSGVALTGVNKFSDYVNSDPISAINTGHAFIENNTGLTANTMLLDKDTLRILRRHPVILDLFKYTAGGVVNDQQLKEVFDVETILVGRGVKNNALEGATASITNIWGNNLLLARVVPGVSLQTQTFGLSFRWRPEGIPSDMQVYRAVEGAAGQRKVEIVEAGYYQTEKVVAAQLCYALTGTL